MTPPEIAETLRLFDRKERHLLIQNCLGTAAGTMCESFCNNLTQALRDRLQSAIQPTAWWASDYHLEWLAGALVWHAEHGREDRGRPRKNPNNLIRGNQEDIDLIVASGSDVILVEAKGHLSWDNSQLTSKIERLSTLCDGDTGIVAAGDQAQQVKLHFVLVSLKQPYKLHYEGWPPWALRDDGPYWMPLKATGDRIRVGRCDCEGHTNAQGRHWHMWQESKLPPI